MDIRTFMTCCLVAMAINTYSVAGAIPEVGSASVLGIPTLAVEGTLRTDVSADLVGLTYDDQSDRLEFTLVNGVNPNYKYSDGALFRPGTKVAIHVGSGSQPPKFAEGRVTEIAASFPGGTVPTITIRAAGSGRQATSLSAVQASYGRGLIEFNAVEKADGSVSCTGIVNNVGELVRGMPLLVVGVGSRLDGNYLVSGTVHSVDRSKGPTTRFTATKAAATLSKPSIKRSG
jgi:hypothetical protein